jgi:hypothetical protein
LKDKSSYQRIIVNVRNLGRWLGFNGGGADLGEEAVGDAEVVGEPDAVVDGDGRRQCLDVESSPALLRRPHGALFCSLPRRSFLRRGPRVRDEEEGVRSAEFAGTGDERISARRRR